MDKTFKIGIAGMKRVGKNVLGQSFLEELQRYGVNAKQYALADELKRELDPLFLLNAGVSAFTEDPVEKERLRGCLIAYGTGYWRDKDPDHWIKKLDSNIKDKEPHVAIITDVRFAANEAPWVKENGYLLHLSRIDDLGNEFPPAGKDEEENDPLLKELANFNYEWNDFKDNKDFCYYEGVKLFNKLFAAKIPEWQKTFPLPTTT